MLDYITPFYVKYYAGEGSRGKCFLIPSTYGNYKVLETSDEWFFFVPTDIAHQSVTIKNMLEDIKPVLYLYPEEDDIEVTVSIQLDAGSVITQQVKGNAQYFVCWLSIALSGPTNELTKWLEGDCKSWWQAEVCWYTTVAS